MPRPRCSSQSTSRNAIVYGRLTLNLTIAELNGVYGVLSTDTSLPLTHIS